MNRILLILIVATITAVSCLSFHHSKEPDSKLKVIERYYEQGDFVRADEEWKLLLLKEPDYVRTQLEAALHSGQYDSALRRAETLSQISKPLTPEDAQLCARAFMENGQREKATQLLETALKQNQNQGLIRILLAESAIDSHNLKSAEKWLSEGIPQTSTRGLVAKGRLALMNKKPEEAFRTLTIAHNLDRSNLSARYYLIQALTELEKLDEAKALVTQTRALVPNDEALKLCDIKIQLKSNPESANSHHRSLKAIMSSSNPELARQARELVIDILESKQQFAEALEMTLQHVEQQEHSRQKTRWLVRASEMAMSMAREYEKKGADNKANASYSKSIELLHQAYNSQTVTPATEALLSARYIELGEHYFDKARETNSSSLKKQLLGYAIFNLERAAELSGGKVSKAHHLLGQILNHLNRHSEAIEHFQRVKSNLSAFVDSIYTYGESCLRVSRFLDALQAFKEVLAVQPDNWKAHRDIGLTYWNLRNRNKAEDHFKQSLNYRKTDPVVWYYLGKIRRSQRRYSDSIVCYKKVKALTKDSTNPTFIEMSIEAGHQLQDIPRQQAADKKLKALGGKPREDEPKNWSY